MKRGQRLEVCAERFDDGGFGVARCGDDEVRVTDLLPGERAMVVVEHVSRNGHGAWAGIEARLGEASPGRVAPACPAFGRCGGCRWQSMAVDLQLSAKKERLRSALEQAGVALEVEIGAVHSSPLTLGYRNKGKYVIGRGLAGAAVLGAYAPRSHDLISTLGCAVLEPGIDAVAQATRSAIERSSLEPYDETDRSGELRYLIVRAGADDRIVATIVSCSSAAPDAIGRLAQAIIDDSPATGVRWAQNDRTDGALLDTAALDVNGDPSVGERLAGRLFSISPTAFWQINRKQAERIYGCVADLVGSSARVLDAYAGVGAIGLAAAKAGAAVTTIEIDPLAVAVTRAVATALALPVTALEGDATAALGGAFDTIVLNPPRRGLAPIVTATLCESGAQQLIYLSCGPASLARDLGVLTAGGYRVTGVQMFDMMPGTAELETLVTLRRTVR